MPKKIKKVRIQDWLDEHVPDWEELNPDELNTVMHSRWKRDKEFYGLQVATLAYTQSPKDFVYVGDTTYSHVKLIV